MQQQRPDAWSGKHVEFHCVNVPGYAEAREQVAKSKDERFSGLDKDQRMAKVYDALRNSQCPALISVLGCRCTSQELATIHFPKASVYIPYEDKPTMKFGDLYDYLSIMQYDCDEEMKWTTYPALTIHPSKVKFGQTNEMWMGGSAHYDRQAISVLDIVRVAMLYKESDEKVAAALALQKTGWEAGPVKIGSFVTVVSPAETSVLLI